ncbi:MAG: AMP-binding protein [Opitutaceae bacterium]|jgi:acyl-CoA synthetase (AMP-forming)/AMP-acid ligase II
MISALETNDRQVALIATGTGQRFTYADLRGFVAKNRELLKRVPRPAVAFQFCANSVGAVASYLACLAEGLPLGLGEPGLEPRSRVIDAYRPTGLILPNGEPAPAEYESAGPLSGGELTLWWRTGGAYPVAPHRDLALLLATSGSTGDAKLVRLSRANLEANARSIAHYLQIKPGEIALQSLPMNYSYGLSVINSHLIAGATVALTGHSFMRPEFWRAFDESACTSFAGVPYMYETLYRLRMNPAERPSLRTLTQAGGHLRVELVRHFHKLTAEKGSRFFVMYGQTEATARISYVPPERLDEKAGSIGLAIPGGELSLRAVEDDPSLTELCYRGPNVMLGYATGPEDLAKGDELGGLLATGDTAERDTDGFYRLTGRLKRMAKLFGKRVNLASIETEVEKLFPVHAAAVEDKDGLRLFLEGVIDSHGGDIRAHLARLLAVPPLAIKVTMIERLPLTSSGKKDYTKLSQGSK